MRTTPRSDRTGPGLAGPGLGSGGSARCRASTPPAASQSRQACRRCACHAGNPGAARQQLPAARPSGVHHGHHGSEREATFGPLLTSTATTSTTETAVKLQRPQACCPTTACPHGPDMIDRAQSTIRARTPSSSPRSKRLIGCRSRSRYALDRPALENEGGAHGPD